MDLGADVGTEVRAAFDGHITRLNPHTPSHDTSSVYGAQLFMRSRNNKMGAFYTHITDVPSGLHAGSGISRGQRLGQVLPGHPSHLHMALVEIIDGAPRSRYMGMNLFSQVLSIARTASVVTVTFHQDGSQPTV